MWWHVNHIPMRWHVRHVSHSWSWVFSILAFHTFPTGAWVFPWAKIRTIIRCRSGILTKHWGFPVWHSMDDYHHGNHAWFPLLECCFLQPKNSITVYKWMKHPTPVSPPWNANCSWSRQLLAMCAVSLIKLWNLNAMVVQQIIPRSCNMNALCWVGEIALDFV